MNRGTEKNRVDSIWDQGEPLARDHVDYYGDWPPPGQFRGITAAIVVVLLVALVGTGGWLAWRALDQGPGDYGERAREYMAEGNYQAAITELETLVQQQPQDAEMHWLLGSARLQLGQPAAALASLESAFELGYFEQPLLMALAQSYLLDGDYEAALDLVREWSDGAESEQASIEWELLRGRTLHKMGRKQLATEAFVKVLQLAPGNREAKAGLAHGGIGPDLAVWTDSDIEAALATGLDQADTWLLKAELELSRDNFDSALAGFERALGMAPDDVYALSGLVRALLAAGDLGSAASPVAELAQRFPADPAGAFARALYARKLGRNEDALAALKVVLEYDPYHPKSLLLLGEVQQTLGDHEQALRNLARFHRLEPGNLQGRKKLAQAYMANGQPERAVELLRALGGAAYSDPEIVALLAEGSGQLAEDGEVPGPQLESEAPVPE
jgi:cytochrome c-type biogenesis protein CcmH/NrfG